MTWNAPVQVADRPGVRLFPWISTGPTGEVGLIWYESNVTGYPEKISNAVEWATCGSTGGSDDAEWFIRYASIREATTPTPVVQDVVAQALPVHKGRELGRPFGEFGQVEFDPSGRAAISYASDTAEGPGRPMFVLQN